VTVAEVTGVLEPVAATVPVDVAATVAVVVGAVVGGGVGLGFGFAVDDPHPLRTTTSKSDTIARTVFITLLPKFPDPFCSQLGGDVQQRSRL